MEGREAVVGKISRLAHKGWTVLRNDGWNSFMHKTVRYIQKRQHKPMITRNFSDILFVNGCTLDHPSRYRVSHQIEQLQFQGISCDQIFYEDLYHELALCYRAFVFFRCPFTEKVGELIKLAKAQNKLTVFDIDDLVFDYQYVKDIRHLSTLSEDEYKIYMDGVSRMGRTLSLCDCAITTTETLATELRKIVPEVFINRNVASERMVTLSQYALKKQKHSSDSSIILGYFSGSITHNPDIELIVPVLQELMAEYDHVFLKLVGFLDVPAELKEYANRVSVEPFVEWERLPELLASIDINLAPLEDTLFNSAKSENKWIEAALVKVPTVASNIGAFGRMIQHEETGLLCSTLLEWKSCLKRLIDSPDVMIRMGEAAFRTAVKHNVTAYTGMGLATFLRTKIVPNIVFVLPSIEISGGVNVVIKHCHILKRAGYDVTIFSMSDDFGLIETAEGALTVLATRRIYLQAAIDKAVATLWSTVDYVMSYPMIKERYYLVQNFETDFYEFGHLFRAAANMTYNNIAGIRYLTISKWCQTWLKDRFHKESRYAPNGIDLANFSPVSRDYSAKIRILIEGNSSDYYKNVDESFLITNQLDREKYEVWYLSYNGKPKEWYIAERFFHKVPSSQVGKIYQQCHILLKSSILESFSYPPLEMMATGGIALVAPNGGNAEYLIDRVNCLLYQSGNIEQAVQLIAEICQNSTLRQDLAEKGIATAQNRAWTGIENIILELYR